MCPLKVSEVVISDWRWVHRDRQNVEKHKEKWMCSVTQTDLGKSPILIAFWDKHGLVRSLGLFQSLVPLSTTLGLTNICNILTGQSVLTTLHIIPALLLCFFFSSYLERLFFVNTTSVHTWELTSTSTIYYYWPLHPVWRSDIFRARFKSRTERQEYLFFFLFLFYFFHWVLSCNYLTTTLLRFFFPHDPESRWSFVLMWRPGSDIWPLDSPHLYIFKKCVLLPLRTTLLV